MQVLLLIPSVAIPGVPRHGHHVPRWIQPTGVALTVIGALAPLGLLRFCVWWQRPSAGVRRQQHSVGGALLHETVRGRNASSVYDVYEPAALEPSVPGEGAAVKWARWDETREEIVEHALTVVVVGGAGAYRELMGPLCRALARRGLRVLCLDLPGGGSLAAVPWSLVNCEQVIHAVADREACLAGRRVLLVSWGASAYAAADTVLRDRKRFAGLVLGGYVPDYVGLEPFTGTEAVHRMAWSRHLANSSLRTEVWARTAGALVSDTDRLRILGKDFNPGVIPDMLLELHGRSLLQDLRDANRAVYFLGPTAWMRRAQELVPVSHVRTRRVAGARHPIIPPLTGPLLEDLAEAIHQIAKDAIPRQEWNMSPEDVMHIRAAVRGVSFAPAAPADSPFLP